MNDKRERITNKMSRTSLPSGEPIRRDRLEGGESLWTE
jgi:hypothetical protein